MVYDYVIGGTGAAGLQLALAMAKDSYFNNKRILLIDKEVKAGNDKRWCFWERGSGQWDELITASWQEVNIRTNTTIYARSLGEYRYKMLSSADFYAYANKVLAMSKNIEWVHDTIQTVSSQQQPVTIVGEKGTYTCLHFFDSRVEEPVLKKASIRVYQHFKGWEVETATDCFNAKQVELMDFRYALPETCSFMYVLPFNARRALVEFTVFSPALLPDTVYVEQIERYLEGVNYRITLREEGVIPMTSIPYHLMGSAFHTKIGTAGSWVKPSTGYSFKSAEGKIKRLIDNIKQERNPSEGLIKERFRYYDRLLLDILERSNGSGVALFDTLYRKNKIDVLFRFLDEDTHFMEELQIMARFDPRPFIRSIVRSLK